MTVILIFGLFLFASTLLSAQIQRSVLSTSVIFLLAGFLTGPSVLDVARPRGEILEKFVESAMVLVLFTDGMRVNLKQLRSQWRLPALALGIGMPATILLTALAARYLVGFDWPHALLLGAILSPTDPVFASALVGRKEVPRPLRDLLNVESGMNDGLALPAVWAMVSLISGKPSHWALWLAELAGGVLIGILIPVITIWLERLERFRAVGIYQTIRGLSIGLIVFGVASLLHANTFLAAFAAGITVVARNPEVKADFHAFGETSAEILKLAGIMGFAMLLTLDIVRNVPITHSSTDVPVANWLHQGADRQAANAPATS